MSTSPESNLTSLEQAFMVASRRLSNPQHQRAADAEGLTPVQLDYLQRLMSGEIGTSNQRGSITRILNNLNCPITYHKDILLRLEGKLKRASRVGRVIPQTPPPYDDDEEEDIPDDDDEDGEIDDTF